MKGELACAATFIGALETDYRLYTYPAFQANFEDIRRIVRDFLPGWKIEREEDSKCFGLLPEKTCADPLGKRLLRCHTQRQKEHILRDLREYYHGWFLGWDNYHKSYGLYLHTAI